MENDAAIVVSLDLAKPVEIDDFVSIFTGLGGQFERFLRAEKPDLGGDVRVYVKEVRKGSMEAVMVIATVYPQVITVMDHLQIATDFVSRVGRSISTFLTPGGRLPNAGKTELSNILSIVMATANDPGGSASIKAVRYKKSNETTECEVRFNTAESKQVIVGVTEQLREIEAVTDSDHENILLTFYQSNRKDSGKTGEKGVIEKIYEKPLAVVYASDLARERIKSEMLDGERNIYKLGFYVDVNVETRAGKPVAYRIKAVHDVIDLPD